MTLPEKKLIGYAGSGEGFGDDDDSNLSDDLLSLLGNHLFLSLVEAVGGTRIYVREKLDADDRMTEIFGHDANRIAVEFECGEKIIIPSQRAVRIHELHAEGMTPHQIALRVDMRVQNIAKIVKNEKAARLCQVVGSARLREVARRHARAVLYVQATQSERAVSRMQGADSEGVPLLAYLDPSKMEVLLLNVLGRIGFETLRSRYGGQLIRIPVAREFRAKRYRLEGLSNRQIARRLCMTETGLEKLFKRERAADEAERAARRRK